MLGRKKSSGSSNATNGTDYITSLITGYLPAAAPGHTIELGLDPTRDLLSLIFDETRIYFNDGVIDPGVIVMGLQAPLFLDFVPSPDLIGEVMLSNKVLISTNLIPVSETNFDLVISADLLLTGHHAEDALNLSVMLTTISVAHNELYDAWESL
jgi:hypothetical protein